MNIETILLIVMWGLLAITCVTIELLTTNLITIWFALGSIVSLIAGAFGVIWYWQIISFLTTTIITLAIGYPLLKRYIHNKPTLKTNLDGLINQQAEMMNDYPNHHKAPGIAKLDGKTWTVISTTNDNFKKGEIVLVTSIIGVKLVIKKI
ncbi:NfeD family protein [Spiroplasma sp. AdecLV25b]|uniref:NfeD family protein n=1 Tax=Spiroplasma sp. AdecLV25b TaxID=3027162 RepID=UPI0027E068BE|nr:NfeD family protein [Spiroplasma sp. AdecLV25b]